MEITVNIKCPDLPLAAAALAKALKGIGSPVTTVKEAIDSEALKASLESSPAYMMTMRPEITPATPSPMTEQQSPTPEPANPTMPAQQTPIPAPSFSQSPAVTIPVGATTAQSSLPAIVPTTPAPQITGDMVAKAGADLIRDDAGKPADQRAYPKLMALLQKYGVGCAQELRPDQIGPFATEMRALGAKI
jgi:hypothetical protein